MDKLKFVRNGLQSLKNEGLYVTIRTIGSPQGAWIEVDNRKVLNLCSNNYLGFCNTEELKKTAKEYIDKFGIGPGAVRTIAGTCTYHHELEKRLAEFKETESAISFQSGFCANLATIPALVGKEDIIYSDELNHASIIDGCRLSRAKVIRYNHCSPDDLEKKLRDTRKNFNRALVVTDGVFSMDGDITPLDRISEVAKKYNCLLMVDDAHGEGVLGRGGRGISHHFGVQDLVDIEVGTLSKAFGVVGGYVAAKKELTEYLRQKGRPFLFSSAVTPPDVAACIAAIDILLKSDERVKKLWENTENFKKEMQNLGFDTGKSATPITPVMLGEAPLAQKFSKRLFEEEIFAQAIGYPTVPKGKARIRVMISATHSRSDLDFALKKFEKVGRELGVIK